MSFLKRVFGKVAEIPTAADNPKKYGLDNEFEFVTDTSTVCVFDIANLKHRLSDTPDWWTIWEDEVLELNEGNLIIAALPEDGKYQGRIQEEFRDRFDYHVSANLQCGSGKVFIGKGERISGDEMEPQDWPNLSGKFINLKPGNYLVDLYLFDGNKIAIIFQKNIEKKNNLFSLPLELCN